MRGRVLEGVSVVPEHPGRRAAATGPQAGKAKMEKMEKIVVRMEKIKNQGLMYSTIKVRERHPRPHHEGTTVFARG